MNISVFIGILVNLLQKEKITAKYISAKYEISIRTVYRYIDILCASGVPIITQSGRNGGISLDKNFAINSLYFSLDEINRLILLCQKDSSLTNLKDKLSYLKKSFSN